MCFLKKTDLSSFLSPTTTWGSLRYRPNAEVLTSPGYEEDKALIRKVFHTREAGVGWGGGRVVVVVWAFGECDGI